MLVGFKANDDYFEIRIDEVYDITETELHREKVIALNLEILMERKNTLDFRHNAAEHINEFVDEKPKVVIPILIAFLESEEAQLGNPEKKKIGYRLMPDPDTYQYTERALKEFSEIKQEVLNSIDPELPEAKEAVLVLIDIVLKEFFKEYIITVLYALLRMSELHQDIRYIVYTKLQDVLDYNFAAKLLLEYMDGLFNQLDSYDKEFCDNFLDDVIMEEKYKDKLFI